MGHTISELRAKISISGCTLGDCNVYFDDKVPLLFHSAANTITPQTLNMLAKWAISCKVAKKWHLWSRDDMQREISQRARGGRRGQRERSAITWSVLYLKGRGGKKGRQQSDVSPQIFRNRDRTLLAQFFFFFVWKIPLKWLLIYAKSNQCLIHNAWVRRYQFCNAFGLLDVITIAADEILALLPVLLSLHGSGRKQGQTRWKCKEDNRKPEPEHPLPSDRG